MAKKKNGFTANPFLVGENNLIVNSDDDSDMDPEEREKRNKFLEHKKKIEAQGFTLVTTDDTNPHRKRGRDTYGTVVEGITDEQVQELMEKKQLEQ